MRMLYSILLFLAQPLVRVRLWWRARKAPAYGERIAERFGYVPEEIPRGVVWVHTVSAGETIAAAPLIRRLVEAIAERGFAEQGGAESGSADAVPQVLVTTMTPTGSAEVQRLFGDSVAHCYAPYDFSSGVQRFVDRVQPRMLVLLETEIWPNMIRLTADRDVPVALVNARLSERSARGYGRLQSLITPVLRQLSWIACQYPADGQRFRDLGVADTQISVTGSVKFDVAELSTSPEQDQQLEFIRRRYNLAARPVWIAGSTHEGEDGILLAAHETIRQRFPEACLIIAPRHPERFAAVAAQAQAVFSAARISDGPSISVTDAETVASPVAANGSDSSAELQADELPAVIIADVMGLLRPLYGLADVAFVGGSLVALGGHNPIEPAVAGLPMLMGPGRFNFEGVCDAFVAAQALQQVTDAADTAAAVAELFDDQAERSAQGARALAVVQANAGATERLLERLTRLAGVDRVRGEASAAQ